MANFLDLSGPEKTQKVCLKREYIELKDLFGKYDLSVKQKYCYIKKLVERHIRLLRFDVHVDDQE